jgi:hypothetical protein
MPEYLEYPIDIEGYIESWGRWEVVRELVTNAMDAGNWEMELQKGNFSNILVITDDGEGLALENLLIGNTGHAKDDKHIGQFGEGLKMALLVLTRFGVQAKVLSGKYQFWNEQGDKFGRPIMRIAYQEVEQHPGTIITVPWPKDEPVYEDRFLRPDDERIFWEDKSTGRMILRQDQPDFFHKGIWVQQATYYGKGFSFGYNLVTTKLGRDRRVVDYWQAKSEVSRIWGCCQDREIIDLYWPTVEASAAEQDLSFYDGFESSEAWQKSFKDYHGKWAVIKTGEVAAREAEHRLAKVVDVGASLSKALGKVLETDAEYVQEMQGESRVPIREKELKDSSLKILRWLRTKAKKVGFGGKIQPFLLGGDGVVAEAHNGNLRLSPKALEERRKGLKILIHELAHTEYGASDRTEQMEDAILSVAADMILGGRP